MVEQSSILRPDPSPAVPANRIGRLPVGLYPRISRKLLAEKVKTAPETITRVLNGSVDPTLALAGRMAAALEMTIDELWAELSEARRERGVKGGRLQKQKAGRKAVKTD
jgi:DNA-binding XRE family transcriptional regulator